MHPVVSSNWRGEIADCGSLRTTCFMKTFLLVVFLGLIWGCKEGIFKDDDTLSIQRKPYTGNQLRIDGYYYDEYAEASYRSALFLYENGIVLDGGGFPVDELNEQEEYFKSEKWVSSARKSKYGWGVFLIEGSTIKFERWYPSSGPPLESYVREGEVLNDTTFVIARSYRVVEGQETEVRQRDETYHFKEFSPKPDSTNGFVW